MFDFPSLNLSSISTIIDVGAGEGAFLEPAMRFYKPTCSIAIEMLPHRAQILSWRFPETPVIQCAVGEVPGVGTILQTKSADSSSLLPVNPESQDWYQIVPSGMDQSEAGTVNIWPLDDMFQDIHRIDLMKMDVQGYEGRAIRGARVTLRRTKYLLIEILFVRHYDGQSEPFEIHRELKALGFHLRKSFNPMRSASGRLLQADALYVNANL